MFPVQPFHNGTAYLVMVHQVKELVVAYLLPQVTVPGYLEYSIQVRFHLLLSSSLLLLSLSLSSQQSAWSRFWLAS